MWKDEKECGKMGINVWRLEEMWEDSKEEKCLKRRKEFILLYFRDSTVLDGRGEVIID
jgi:hypothetical protein